MKLSLYIFALALALLFAFEAEWFAFWLLVPTAVILIVVGNHRENEFINHN